MDRIEKEEIKLQKAKERINLLKNIEREKEKKQLAKKFAEIGRLAMKANIAGLELETLLGAFLEISIHQHDKNQMENWKKQSQKFLLQKANDEKVALTVTCKSEPSKEIKDYLKKLSLTWNPIRREFFGYGFKSEIESFVDGKNCVVEVMPYE